MKNRIYALNDRLSGRVGQVYVFSTDDLCLHTLYRAIPDGKVDLYTRQYDVMLVGEIDVVTGEVFPVTHKILSWDDVPFLETLNKPQVSA